MIVSEELIRPREIFDEYLRLSALDARSFFDGCPRTRIDCPACGTAGSPAFEKLGFTYEECPACRTLFVSPRPEANAFERYYTQSESSRYWASTFYPKTADARREALWKPKAALIHEFLRGHGSSNHSVIDIGAGYGIFAEVYAEAYGAAVTCIEPSPELSAACRGRGLQVIEGFLSDMTSDRLPAGPRAFVSFELFEHLVDPGAFLREVRALCSPGDLFVFTTLSGAGLDIRVLWESSKSVSPPHHLNFLNPWSARALALSCGFSSVEVRTPGVLDLDILANSPQLTRDRFWSLFLSRASAGERSQFQALLSGSGWSSHMMVCCRA
jgi:SAM-dependent methyltransferase